MGETPLPLTRSEYAICEHLVLHAGQTFTKEQIYEAVFGPLIHHVKPLAGRKIMP